MGIIKPKPLRPDQLKHPKDPGKRWNGEVREKAFSSFNGNSEWEDKGFSQRRESQGLTVTHGTTVPDHQKPVNRQTAVGAIQPVPADHIYSSQLRRAVPNPPPLTDRQKRQKKGHR